VGNDLYHNNKKVLTVNGDRDSVYSIIKQLKSKIKESVNEDIKSDVNKFLDKLNKEFSDQEYTTDFKGGKYARITHQSRKFGNPSAWGFIAMDDNPSKGFKKGDLLKAAGFNTPAKHARGNILNGDAKYDKYSPTYLKEDANPKFFPSGKKEWAKSATFFDADKVDILLITSKYKDVNDAYYIFKKDGRFIGSADSIKGGKPSGTKVNVKLSDVSNAKSIGDLKRMIGESLVEAKNIKWQDVEVGDSANVTSINKTGVIIKTYGRKFHIKFANGTTKTYDASELTFIKESVNEEKPGLWANIRAKQARGGKPAHGNSQAHKDAVKAGKEINKNEEVVNEISAIDGLTDVIDGKTSSIEGVKLSKDMAEHIMYWVRTSPYGKKYGTWFKRNGIAKLLPIAFMWGLDRYLPSNLKSEFASLKSKYGKAKNESVNEASLQKGKTYGGTSAKEGMVLVAQKGLEKILDLSKKNPSNVFLVSDDNYTKFGPYYVKNGKVAKYTVANPNYDLERNKVRTLKVPSDVILSFRVVE
jgi:hypothetical protein